MQKSGSNRKRILMLNYEFPPLGGGGAVASFELAKAYKRSGISVTVLTMGDRNLPKTEIVNGVNINRVRVPKKNRGHHRLIEIVIFLIKATIIAPLLKEDYDYIHAHTILPVGPLAFLLSLFFRVPFIVTAHGSDVPGHSRDKVILLQKLTKPIFKFIVKKAKFVTAQSKPLKNLIVKNVGSFIHKDKIVLLPNGVNEVVFKDADLNHKDKYIFSCTRLSKEKGLFESIEAFHESDIPDDWKFLIAGSGKDSELLKNMATNGPRAKQIEFLGWLNYMSREYIDLYSKGSILLMPSYYENFSITILEAMASKCALIVSDIPSIVEEVKDNAILVPTKSSRSIKDKIELLVNNDHVRRKIAIKGYKHLMNNYTWDMVVKGYLDLLI